ncbi:MAG: type II toxin-antitoxin system Phd/YefM family antitoxin [Gemmatimonadetes bacterium]|nr:type II toxin-antitoxin system Phd/YefM family antitoxin [Gemmatimonadota bacterium]
MKPSRSSRSSRKKRPRRGSGSIKPVAKRVPLAEVKDDLSRYLRLAADEEIVITRHGRPAGVLIGFHSDDDWFEYRMENDLEFLRRVAEARADLRLGRGVPLEHVDRD